MIDCDGAAVNLGLEDDSSTFFTFLDYSAVSGCENDMDKLKLGAILHWDMKNSCSIYYYRSRISLGLRILVESSRHNADLHGWGWWEKQWATKRFDHNIGYSPQSYLEIVAVGPQD